ncbi:MAG: ATP synthase F1 subunit gamma [bacterium]
MATGRAIKNRIRSTQNIRQITKAMEAVSAVKMRKSEASAIKGRPYALYALSILKHIEEKLGELPRKSSPLFDVRTGGKNLFVVITSDKGLAGSFNSNVIRKTEIALSEFPGSEIIAIGKRGRDYFNRRGSSVVSSFDGIGDFAELFQVEPISKKIISLFENKTYDKVSIIYTNFISALKQEIVVRPLLPLETDVLKKVIENIIPITGKFSELRKTALDDNFEYKFETDVETIVKGLVPALVEIEILHCVLEANASEHASRMVAMKNASENAKDMIGELTILFNKTRQAQITKELIEITSGKEALENQN